MKISTRPDEALDDLKKDSESAVENAVDDAVVRYQEIFDNSENVPQYTPKEIDALYPGLRTNAGQQALRRVGNASGTPRGKHLVHIVAAVDALRAGTAYSEYWKKYASTTYPDASLKDKERYFIDILVLWCLPAPAEFAEAAGRALADANYTSEDDYLFEDPASITQADLDTMGRDIMHRISKVEKQYPDKNDRPAFAENELDNYDRVLSTIRQIELVLEGDYYGLWYEIMTGLNVPNVEDRSERIVELLRAFVR